VTEVVHTHEDVDDTLQKIYDDAIAGKGAIIRPEWQQEDLAYLGEKDATANWSEMGCFKTSTCLWLMQEKVKELTNPRCMIITTAGGKGTYFDLVPKLLPQYTLINVLTKGAYLVVPNSGGRQVKIADSLPKDINVPHIVLTHYNVFAKFNRNKMDPCPACNQSGFENIDGLEIPCQVCKGRLFIEKSRTMADMLVDRQWDYLAVDEAHRLKGKDNKWTVCIKWLKSPNKHIMTGTGFINRPDEIWSLLHFLDRTRFSSYNKFVEYFCEVDDYSGYRQIVGVKPEVKDEFRALVREFGVRRTLDEVMPHIKRPVFIRKEVELNKDQRRIYDEIKNELQALDKNGVPFHSPNVLAALTRMRQVCVATPEVIEDYYDEKKERRVLRIKLVEPSSKLDELMDLIEDLEWDEENKQQLVVFSNFADPLNLLAKRLEAAKIPYLWMRADDDEQTRYDKWHETWPKKEHRVFLSTLQLGSESINLTSARHVCFLDRSWSPKDNQQGIGRIRRPGQDGEPVVINIEAVKTTDQKLEGVNIMKEGWFKEIFGDENGS